jgi:hypothetical protein
VDNFDHYGLRSQLVALIGADAALWGEGYGGSLDGVDTAGRGGDGGGEDRKSQHRTRGTWVTGEGEGGNRGEGGDGIEDTIRDQATDSDIKSGRDSNSSASRPFGWGQDLDQYGQVRREEKRREQKRREQKRREEKRKEENRREEKRTEEKKRKEKKK